MKKFLFVYLVLFSSFLFACAACQLMVPKIKVDMTLYFEKKTLKNTHMSWKFSKSFISDLIIRYDDNRTKGISKHLL